MNNYNEKFSVLMSLYYKEKKENLKMCLNSIEQQILKPTEVVIVYDGEVPDELKKVVNNYIVSLNIKIVQLDKNYGLGLALNEGILKCSNEIIARMDTDDVCLPHRFLKQIPYFSNKKLDLLGSSIIEFDPETNLEREKKLPETYTEIHKFAKLKNPFNHMTVVFKKSAVLSVSGYKHHLYMEDYNLWLRMIKLRYNMENLPDILLKATVSDEMIYRRRGYVYIKNEFKLFKLKCEVYNNFFYNLLIFLFRSLTRIIPIKILKFLYSRDRKKL